MKCNTCQSNEATIHLSGVGAFCLDCHNDYMADLLGVEKMVDFSKMISRNDAEGIEHQFKISNMIMPGFSAWKAAEINGGYQFEVFVKPEENQARAIKALHQKISTGMGYQTLQQQSDRHHIENAIQIDNKQYSLNSIGSCRIAYADGANSVCLVMDGKNIVMDDFGLALSAFEGFNMDFQIRNVSDGVIGKNMALKPVCIHPDSIMAHFEKTLGWFLERGFLSYKFKSVCVEALAERIDELELLYQCGSRADAVEVGKRMKKRLLSIDHDTDDFPDYLLELIDGVIGY